MLRSFSPVLSYSALAVLFLTCVCSQEKMADYQALEMEDHSDAPATPPNNPTADLLRTALEEGVDSVDSDKKRGSVPRLEFVWDKIVITLMALAGLVAAFDNLERLLINSPVECFVPNGTSRDQAAYINSFCYAFLPSKAYIPFYLPYFIVIGDSMVAATHYLWVLICQGKFRSFFGSIAELELHRNPKTGKYGHKTVQIFGAMEKAAQSHWITILYLLKVFLQCVILFGASAACVFALLNTFEQDVILKPKTHLFECPNDNFTNEKFWVLKTQVYCVHTPRQLLTSSIALMINILLFGIAGMVLIGGLAQLFFNQPSRRLMAKEIATFVFESPFLRENYNSGFSCPFVCPCTCLRTQAGCSCSIHSDFDFLIVVLFRSNSGKGRLLRDIHIQSELDKLNHKQLMDMHRTNPQMNCELQTKLYLEIQRFCQRQKLEISAVQELTLVCITFGPPSCAKMLYSAFRKDKKKIRVVVVDFDPYLEFKFVEESVCEEFIAIV